MILKQDRREDGGMLTLMDSMLQGRWSCILTSQPFCLLLVMYFSKLQLQTSILNNNKYLVKNISSTTFDFLVCFRYFLFCIHSMENKTFYWLITVNTGIKGETLTKKYVSGWKIQIKEHMENWDVLTLTDVSVNQKSVNVCEHSKIALFLYCIVLIGWSLLP